MSQRAVTGATAPSVWRRNTAEFRWYAFGRYYAMFPSTFAREVVEGLTNKDDLVLDPFCGRGNGPFTATVLGRRSIGIDVNPLAWLYTAAKLRPPRKLQSVLDRLTEIGEACRTQDRKARTRFECMAWAPGVRSFLRAARRELDWRSDHVDRTLMGFVMLHMQDKLGSGLSNHLWPTIACSPTYAVKWWTRNGLVRPPDLDSVAVLADKIRRRYQYGTPEQMEGQAFLGDARTELERQPAMKADLLLTSPPYIGVTDYWNDHWIRLWMLGYSFRKNWTKAAKFGNQSEYEALLHEVFRQARRHMQPTAPVLVRSDQRRLTADTCKAVLRRVWPDRTVYLRATAAPDEGVSRHHGRGGRRAKELDILLLRPSNGSGAPEWAARSGFQEEDDQRLGATP